MSLEKLPEILQALADEGVDYVLIGAVAMMAHGLVRGTEDLDFFVRPDAKNIARLRAALRRVFPEDATIDEISERDLARRVSGDQVQHAGRLIWDHHLIALGRCLFV